MVVVGAGAFGDVEKLDAREAVNGETNDFVTTGFGLIGDTSGFTATTSGEIKTTRGPADGIAVMGIRKAMLASYHCLDDVLQVR